LIDADSVLYPGSVLSDAALARLSGWPGDVAADLPEEAIGEALGWSRSSR